MSAIARRSACALLARIEAGRLVVREPSRADVAFGPLDAALSGTVDVRDPRSWAALLRGSASLGTSYADGWWDTDDLVAVLRIAARDVGRLDRVRGRALPLIAPLQALSEHARRSTPPRARERIAAHYDLGDELFARMLDPTMTYSCAIYAHPGDDLEEAQRAKLDRVCARLELDERDHLLEIGSGWGALAIHAARHYGCRVTTTTISPDQLRVARRRVREAGLDDRVTVLDRDYRRLDGRFSKLASVEMIEAVGPRHLPAFFRCLGEHLNPDGLALVQAIIADPLAYELVRGTKTFIQVVFPGARLPSLEVIAGGAQRHGDLRIVGVEDITAHYVRTLATWRERFAAASERGELRCDERFRRLWTFYLAYCEAGFAERRIQDLQILLAGPRRRSEPALAPVPITIANTPQMVR